MKDFFVSYAREDIKFARDLHDAFMKDGKDAWVDWEGILPTAEWLQEIHSAIEAVHTFVFIISPSSVASEMCLKELAYAVELKRRLVPVVCSEVEEKLVPESLRPLQWIFFRPGDSFEHSLEVLKTVVDKDLDWLRTERRIGLRAKEWQRKGHDASLLLFGSELREAQEWLAEDGREKSLVTELHAEYVTASAEAESARLSSDLADLSHQLLNRQHDLALLLGVEAVSAAETVEARGSLLAAVQAHPHLDTWLRGTSSALISVAFNSSGGVVAAGTVDGMVIIWEVETRRARAVLKCFSAPNTVTPLTEPVTDLAFSPNGQILAAAISSGVVIWELETLSQVGPLIEAGTYPLTSLAFSPDSRLLAFAATSGELWLLDLHSGSPTERGVVFAPEGLSQHLKGHTKGVECVVFSPDGTMLASGGRDKTIRLWDVAKREPIGEPLAGHDGWVASVEFNTDGRHLASGSLDGTVILWDVSTRAPVGRPFHHDASGVTGVAFSRNGETMASTAIDGTIALWDIGSRQQLIKLRGHAVHATRVAFSPSEDLLASSGTDGAVILWNMVSGSPIRAGLTRHRERVAHVAFSPDGKILASGAWDGLIILSGIPFVGGTDIPLAHNQKITDFAFSPDGKILASSTFGWLIMLWDVMSGQPLAQLAGHNGKVESLSFSPDGSVLASSAWDGSVILWDVMSRKLITQIVIEKNSPIFTVAFSPDGKTLAASIRNSIIAWELLTGKMLDKPFSGHTDAVTSISFHPNSGILASGSIDQTVRLWDVASRQPLGRPLAGDSGIVYLVAFSPDGELLASAHAHNLVGLWDTASRKLIGELKGYSGDVYSVAFSPDGRLLASGSCKKLEMNFCEEGQVVLWNVLPEFWKARACRMANRNLSHDEWRRYFGDEDYRKTCANLPGPSN